MEFGDPIDPLDSPLVRMGSKQRNADAGDGGAQVLSDDPDVLREQLQEKEQLVAALTNRLEQAA